MFPCTILKGVESFDLGWQHAVRSHPTVLGQGDKTPETPLGKHRAARSRRSLARYVEAAHTNDSVSAPTVCHFGFHQAVRSRPGKKGSP